LTARFTRPSLPALHPCEDPLGIHQPVQRIRNRRLLRLVSLAGRLIPTSLFTLQFTNDPRTPPDLGRELVAARRAVLLILGLISLDRLTDDPPGDPVIVNVGVTRCAR
jgi:hypothetical protein